MDALCDCIARRGDPTSQCGAMSASLLGLPTVLLQHLCTFLPLSDALAHLRCAARSLAAPGALPPRALFRNRIIQLRHHCHVTQYALPECAVPPRLRHAVRALQYDAQGFYPAQYRSLVEVAGMTVAKPMRLAAAYSDVEELHLLHANVTMHELAFDTIFLTDATPATETATAGAASASAVPPAWQLRSLHLTGPHAYVGDSEKDEDRLPVEHARLHRTLLERLLPLHASTLRVLEIRLQACTAGLSLSQRVQQQRDDELLMSAMVRAVVQAQLTRLERLRLEYEQECSFDEEQQRTKCVGYPRSEQQRADALDSDQDDPLVFYNFSQYSPAKARLMSRLFDSLPSLTSLQVAWIHPLLVLPCHASLAHLHTLHYSGLLTYAALPLLARFVAVQHLLIDFFVHEDELRSEWKGEPLLDQSVGGIRSVEEEEALQAAAAAAVPNTHAAPLPLAEPDATRSSDVDVSFFLFRTLSRLTDLRSLQLQSTLQDRNCCRVDWKNFTLLQSLSRLSRLQFSVYVPPPTAAGGDVPVSVSRELDRLCDTLPHLEDVIVNIERMEDAELHDDDEDEDEEEEEEDEEEQGERNSDDENEALAAAIQASTIEHARAEATPAATSSVSATELASPNRSAPAPVPVAVTSLAPYSPATHRVRHLKKLGIWDGHAAASVSASSSHGAGEAPCILTNLQPFLASYPHLRALSLIFCHVSALQPLHLLGNSLVSLCLYFTQTTSNDTASAAAAAGGSDALLVATADANIAALSSLRNLHWLILHGTGEVRTCLSAGQLVQLGAVVNSLPRLRNWHLQHQPCMSAAVWRRWVDGDAPLRFPALASLSFRDCANLGVEGAAAVLDDVTASVRLSATTTATATAGADVDSASSSLPPLLPSLSHLNLMHTCSLDDDASRVRDALTALQLAQSVTPRHVHVDHSLPA